MAKKEESQRAGYSYWRKSKDVFMQGIDKNETLPSYAKSELKDLLKAHFQFMGRIIGTYELMYLREKQKP